MFNKIKFLKSWWLIFTTALIVVSMNEAKASHVLGADISYRCISNLKFEITVKYYRDCRGIGFGNPILNNEMIDI
jgi:hypothetical protein